MKLFALDGSLRFPKAPPREYTIALFGDLSVDRLLLAYANGYFPMYLEGEPVQWHSPARRFVLYPARLHVPYSLERVLRKGKYTVTFDRDFRGVITRCRHADRPNQDGETWITPDMVDAYCALHAAGFAHSVEVRLDGELVGGLYGVALGRVFSGESMFHTATDASKVGVVTLVRRLRDTGCRLIDCQQESRLFRCLGGEFIGRAAYLHELRRAGVPAELEAIRKPPANVFAPGFGE